MMNKISLEQKIFYALHIAMVMCMIGHGAFGIITKQIWCNYFGVFGIGHDMSYRLMPYVGSVDILMGIIMLVYPNRAIALWLVAWGFITASLRPLSGEPFAELIERAGNFGAPFALLLLCGLQKNIKTWFAKIDPKKISLDEKRSAQLAASLKIMVFLLLAGHGWLNIIQKKGILLQYESLGFTNPMDVAATVGVFEILAAFSILVRPLAPIILFFFIWKMTSELFYPQWELFEWIERGGSYGALLALYFYCRAHRSNNFLYTLKERRWNINLF
ncbi:MAG: hypothetical protein JST47_08440 [Bacteroidetes bacterium]|nr:hypothetical protein [Bacteroidota bacterium]MBS1973659.1 hypothetical protein [Bacteroidota bacterium]